jgi:hypothetical protein
MQGVKGVECDADVIAKSVSDEAIQFWIASLRSQ